jgi:prephenate dehydratase
VNDAVPKQGPEHSAGVLEVAIQGELGSNSHMAALRLFRARADAQCVLVPCASAIDLFAWLAEPPPESASRGSHPRCAVLPIENSLHGAVFEHYDLLFESVVQVIAETQLHIRHNVIAAPGVRLADIRQVRSHPVALSQCRRWLRAHPHIEVMPFYDTAGSVKRLMVEGLRDVAGIAPELAADEYGAQVIVPQIEDHAENYTRFLLLAPRGSAAGTAWFAQDADKLSVAFTLEHKPGTLMDALEVFRAAGVNLTKIESRPVPGQPWEYVFFVDVRFETAAQIDGALARLRERCVRLQMLGRYKAAETV